MKYITDADYRHTKRVWENFEIGNLGKYHDLCLKQYSIVSQDI